MNTPATAVKLEALEWQATVAGGQVALCALAILSCIGLTALVTYVLEEVRHEHELAEVRRENEDRGQ